MEEGRKVYFLDSCYLFECVLGLIGPVIVLAQVSFWQFCLLLKLLIIERMAHHLGLKGRGFAYVEKKKKTQILTFSLFETLEEFLFLARLRRGDHFLKVVILMFEICS